MSNFNLIRNSNGNSKENYNRKPNENNLENDILNQPKILSPKTKTREEKIEDLITLGNSAIDAMKKATEAMEKSIKNQEIMVKYIYNAVKKQEKEEENRKMEEEQKKNIIS